MKSNQGSIFHKRVLSVVAVVFLAALAASVADAATRVYGNLRQHSGNGFYEVLTYLIPMDAGNPNMQAAWSGHQGLIEFHNIAPGTYMMAAPSAFEHGPAYYGPIQITDDYFDFGDCPFAESFAPKGASTVITGRQRYGQTFVSEMNSVLQVHVPASGTSPAGVSVTFYEGGPGGPQVGPTKSGTRTYWVEDQVRLVPGQTYYVEIVSNDSSLWNCDVNTDNWYTDGQAYFDGVPQPTLDLAISLLGDHEGYISQAWTREHNWIGGGWGPDGNTYGQTFIAEGTSLSLVAFRANRGTSTVQVYANGPGGAAVGPSRTISFGNAPERIMAWKRGELPLVPGERYYIEITGTQTPFQCIVKGGHYAEGDLYINRVVQPGNDLYMWLMEHTSESKPPMALLEAGGTAGDGENELHWSVGLDSDYKGLMIRVSETAPPALPSDGSLVVERDGVCTFSDRYLHKGLANGKTYHYGLFPKDEVGNYGAPSQVSLAPGFGKEARGVLLNGGFEASWAPEYARELRARHWVWGGLVGTTTRNNNSVTVRGGYSHDGSRAMYNSSFDVHHDINHYQRIPAHVGHQYVVTADSWRLDAWNNAAQNEGTYVGIEPNGGLDPWSPTVEWSGPVWTYDQWATQSRSVRAQAETITVFLRAKTQYAGNPMRGAFDNVTLVDNGPIGTYTPTHTASPTPTDTFTPVESPTPTITNTPVCSLGPNKLLNGSFEADFKGRATPSAWTEEREGCHDYVGTGAYVEECGTYGVTCLPGNGNLMYGWSINGWPTSRCATIAQGVNVAAESGNLVFAGDVLTRSLSSDVPPIPEYRIRLKADTAGGTDYDLMGPWVTTHGNWSQASIVLPAGSYGSQVRVAVDLENLTLEGSGSWAHLYVDNLRFGRDLGCGPTPTPDAPDIDRDGVSDALEGWPPEAGQSHMLLHDSDGDGLSDGVEDANRNGMRDPGETDTRNRDSDGDGLWDGIEVLFCVANGDPLDPDAPASYTDADKDGLPSTCELMENQLDSDGDRFTDGYEAAAIGWGKELEPGQIPPLGDLNLDGFVSNIDALIAQSLFIGNIGPESEVFGGSGFRNADPNRDGFISNLDALLMQAFFIGNLARLPL